MKQYRYTLDKSSRKFICPSCSKKRFVRYIDNENNEYCDEVYGRCDREQSCGYSSSPNQNSTLNTNSKPIKIAPTSFINRQTFETTLKRYDINPFVSYLYSRFKDTDVRSAIERYKIGTAEYQNGSTIFWQIDTNKRVRTGKVMKYNKSSGKRIRGSYSSINWAHSLLKIKDFELEQCLFGMHLIDSQTKKLAIVEAEKTAVIMSILRPQVVWLATGSLGGFKYGLLKNLISMEIIAFPDKGAFPEWQKTSKHLNEKGFNIRVSSLLERNKMLKDGDDIIDALEKVDIDEYSTTELQVDRLIQANPLIRELIDTFNLSDEYDNEIRDVQR